MGCRGRLRQSTAGGIAVRASISKAPAVALQSVAQQSSTLSTSGYRFGKSAVKIMGASLVVLFAWRTVVGDGSFFARDTEAKVTTVIK